MAAAGSKGRAIAGSFGKRICDRIWIAKHYDPAIFLISRASHSGSLYEKDVEEHVSQVPDDVIGTRSEKKYWGPHPTTGVFGPNDPKAGDVTAVSRRPDPPESGNRGPSALDETVRFRQLELEDVEIEDQN